MKLAGKRALITGASEGFGLAVAQAYVQEGVSVMICARRAEKLAEAARGMASVATGGAKVAHRVVDISSVADVDALVRDTIQELGGLDILIANAGVHGPIGELDAVNFDAWRDAVKVNLIGTVYCCRAVTPVFKSQKHGKIVLLSGGGATKPMPNFSAYAATKTAVVQFGEALAEELSEFNVDVNSVAPGALNTRLLDEVLAAGPEKVGKQFYDASVKQKESGGTPLEKGTGLCVFLGSDASKGITGRLISAVWDPWERLPELAPQLAKSDIYTLRRIAPEERNRDWGEPK